jgi:hypothetical protein
MARNKLKTTDAKQKGKQDSAEGNQQRALDQGGHEGMRGHAGQHSGGMGGEHGGDLHDVGSAQSGMTGGGGMGGNSRNRQADERLVDTENADEEASADVQQRGERQGMGGHRQGAATKQ